MQKEKKLKFSTTQTILLSFLGVIFIGSILLSLPISSATGESVSFIDALFTATTSVCVTGLVTLPTVSAWSLFGQIVILILIQIGGLGFIAIVSGLMILFTRRMGIGHKLLIQDAFNLNTMEGLSKFIRNVLLGTLFIEALGALFCMTVLFRNLVSAAFGFRYSIPFPRSAMRVLIFSRRTVFATMPQTPLLTV